MLLDISSALQNIGEIYNFELTLELNSQNIYGQIYNFSPVNVKGIYTCTEDEVYISGDISTTIYTQCGRCLKDIQQELNYHFSESLKENDSLNSEELDDDFFVYDGNKVDIQNMIKNIILTILPIKLVCKDNCENSIYLSEDDIYIGSKNNPFSVLQDAFKTDEEV